MQAGDELIVVRHGETEWSRDRRHTGRTDLPLTTAGREQARAVAALLQGRTPALVLTSPLRRAADTCQLAGFGDIAEVDEDLMEWNYGVHEGRTTAQIQQERPGWLIWTGEVPEGETVEAVGARADRALERIAPVDGDVLVFAHAHLLRILAARWLELHPREGRRFQLDTTAIGVLGFEHGNRVVRRWNVSAL